MKLILMAERIENFDTNFFFNVLFAKTFGTYMHTTAKKHILHSFQKS